MLLILFRSYLKRLSQKLPFIYSAPKSPKGDFLIIRLLIKAPFRGKGAKPGF
jgi:hypothetical protein